MGTAFTLDLSLPLLLLLLLLLQMLKTNVADRSAEKLTLSASR
jgi:hypothetical protein